MMPKLTKHYLGFYVEDELKGVLTLGRGTQPRQTINKLFPSLDTNHYFEIGKMCIAPELNKTNAGSQLLSATIRWMKQNTDCLFLYTLGDGIMGKCGYVYQSANFYYGGKYWTECYIMDNGEKVHIRSVGELTKLDTVQKNKELVKTKGFQLGKSVKRSTRLSYDFMKKKRIRNIEGLMFRYIYPLNKNAKRLMEDGSNFLWNQNNYPKEEDLEWMDTTDKKNKTKIKRPSFSFENVKYNSIQQTSGSTLDSFFF